MAATRGWIDRLKNLGGEYRHPDALSAFAAVMANAGENSFSLSIGGGPNRPHPRLVNLNRQALQNVDVVGDAYETPFRDGSVDAIYCEATIEHLECPEKAVDEMVRLLRPGGEIFAATPFLQQFHGYPSHYQNFTLIGHRRLFERAGLTVLEAGVCTGPTYALSVLLHHYALNYVPTFFLSRLVAGMIRLLFLLLRPLDIVINRNPQAHVLASQTYVRARQETSRRHRPKPQDAEKP